MLKNKRELLIEKNIPHTEVWSCEEKVWKNKHGQLHSFNGQPAYINYWRFLNVAHKQWYKKGVHIKTETIELI